MRLTKEKIESMIRRDPIKKMVEECRKNRDVSTKDAQIATYWMGVERTVWKKRVEDLNYKIMGRSMVYTPWFVW